MIFGGLDPGTRKSALATGTSSALLYVGFEPEPVHVRASHILIELPRIYPETPSKDLNDLIDLAAVAGGWQALNPYANYVYPRDWKGTVAKPVHHLRLWRSMPAHDQEMVAKAAGYTPANMLDYIEKAASARALGTKVTYSRQAHNLLDAYGIYIEARKRYGKSQG